MAENEKPSFTREQADTIARELIQNSPTMRRLLAFRRSGNHNFKHLAGMEASLAVHRAETPPAPAKPEPVEV